MLLEVLVFSKRSATRSLCRHVHNSMLLVICATERGRRINFTHLPRICAGDFITGLYLLTLFKFRSPKSKRRYKTTADEALLQHQTCVLHDADNPLALMLGQHLQSRPPQLGAR